MCIRIKNLQFILDENVDNNLLSLFRELNLNVSTIQFEGWSGFKDTAILNLIENKNYVFITRDKGFEFLWKKHNLKVVYLNIHPPNADFIDPHLRFLLLNWDLDLNNPFFARVEIGKIRSWRK